MSEMVGREIDVGDEIHARLKAAIEVPVRRCLWTEADAITFVPPVLSKIYGDGLALFKLTTINNRPAFWVIRGDSGWDCGDTNAPDDIPDFGDFTNNILDDLEDEFGRARCGYSGANLYLNPDERGCDCEDCSDPSVAKWPMVDGDVGCSWDRMKWPEGFHTVKHPWAWAGDLLSVDP